MKKKVTHSKLLVSRKQFIILVTLYCILASLLLGTIYTTHVMQTQAEKTEITHDEADVLERLRFIVPIIKFKEPLIQRELWRTSTGGEYPTIKKTEQIRIDVDISLQRLFIYEEEQLIYTMTISSGLLDEVNQTPLGEFIIQPIRGKQFFNQELGEGALNYVSFKDYGVYLFHSVPIKPDGDINLTEAAKLGTPASHGCIRLSLPDSEWFYETIQAGTPVNIY